jgi:hypothetical protein
VVAAHPWGESAPRPRLRHAATGRRSPLAIAGVDRPSPAGHEEGPWYLDPVPFHPVGSSVRAW